MASRGPVNKRSDRALGGRGLILFDSILSTPTHQSTTTMYSDDTRFDGGDEYEVEENEGELDINTFNLVEEGSQPNYSDPIYPSSSSIDPILQQQQQPPQSTFVSRNNGSLLAFHQQQGHHHEQQEQEQQGQQQQGQQEQHERHQYQQQQHCMHQRQQQHQQSIQQRQTAYNGSNLLLGSNDDDNIGMGFLDSPQPMTVKKLKSHLSGVGGVGGYLTSPMGLANATPTQAAYLQAARPLSRNANQLAGQGAAAFHYNQLQSAGSPLKSNLANVQNFALGGDLTQRSVNNNAERMSSPGAPPMHRYRSAPAHTQAESSIPPYPQLGPQNNRTARNATAANIGLGIPGTALNSSNYTAMQSYASQMLRNQSTDNAITAADGSSDGILPMPDNLSRTSGAIGRGGRNAKNLTSPTQHSSNSVSVASTARPNGLLSQLSPRHHANFDKPFIQYLPPNSPAAKSAARNRKQLAINTKDDQDGEGGLKAAGSRKASQKLVAVKMTDDAQRLRQQAEAVQRQQLQHNHHHQQQQMQKAAQRNYTLSPPHSTSAGYSPHLTQFSNGYSYNGTAHPSGSQSAPLPNFEFSLEQFGIGNSGVHGDEGLDHNGDAQDQLDLNAVLGLPAASGMESGSSAGSHNPMLSPPPHSAASTHSSVFSAEEELMFGLPPSPFFGPTDSIDQALASLLNGNQVPCHPGQQQQQQIVNSQQGMDAHGNLLSPQHLQQAQLGISSPPVSPLRCGTPANASQQYQQQHQQQQQPWSPYANAQQANNLQSPETYLDPALRSIDNMLLSPRAYQANQNLTASGRPISSPKRLRGMQSAPDLSALYNQQQQNLPPFRTQTPRRTSMKRDRDFYDTDGGEDQENLNYSYGTRSGYNSQMEDEDVFTDDDDDDGASQYYGEQEYHNAPPAKRRSVSTSAALAEHPNFQSPGKQPLGVINPNPSRLRPGPKPKTSLPNLQAARQRVFVAGPNAPPVPSLPPNFASNTANANLLPPSALSPSLSPDPSNPALHITPQNSVSKDTLATFYTIGTGSKQTKKGRPQRVYLCLIPGCGKEFPRKSAVESHIQTHLEDKPFACPYDDW